MLVETPIVFVSHGVPLAGRLFRAASAGSARQPAVVVSGSWLTVKEQMAATYARALAARGYTALTFDFAGFGESHGAPREAEMPSRKIDDIVAATRFAATLALVEPGAVGYLAICASAQYALAALTRGAPVRALASVAGWFHDAASLAPFYGGEDGVARRLARARAATEAFLATGEVRAAPAYAPGDERAGMHFELAYYGDPSRGAVAAWSNRMAELTWQHWLTFDGLATADAVTTPTLLVHGDGCALPDNARRVHARLRGPTELAWLDGQQIDFYDRPHHVAAAVERADAWFTRTLRD